ncbi:hypothetical protein SERLA73DRAFT_186250 [Serpula lacrymans var. lacrymans S7.3]|uniref:Uncharacterized protein n=1 Tax=Serpula lacrymans var. lacrymans (strain S7.3) TaxID=936435 RepID=F8Q5M0_SERL3|nr:hypothetical protein SERLA73DRAFT_186250 [Serpula lacrymans var. lacrymans S7.3]
MRVVDVSPPIWTHERHFVLEEMLQTRSFEALEIQLKLHRLAQIFLDQVCRLSIFSATPSTRCLDLNSGFISLTSVFYPSTSVRP